MNDIYLQYLWLSIVIHISTFIEEKNSFVIICKKYKIKNIEMAYDILYSTLSDKELSSKWFIEPESIRQQRYRLHKKLGQALHLS